MGQPDLSTKGLLSYPDVAADIVNVFVYNGKQVVHEKDLRAYVSDENVVGAEGKLKGLSRDNCMENLLQMVEMPDDPQIQKYVKNYEINLINLRELSPEQMESFQSDFGCIAKYMNKYYNKRKFSSIRCN